MAGGRLARRLAAPVVGLITLAAALIAAAPSSPAVGFCGSNLCPIELTFYGPIVTTNPSDSTLCDYPAKQHGACLIKLRGALYLPGGKALSHSSSGLPVIVFVHGSTTNNTAYPAAAIAPMATYFTAHGYAFYALHRRGHGDSTGKNLDGLTCNGCTYAQNVTYQLQNLANQVFEVHRAINFLLRLRTGDPTTGPKLVNPKKVAILGHSLGGIIALYANTLNIGQRTAIAISAASESWDYFDFSDGSYNNTSPGIESLKSAVANHVTPPMLFAPANDCSTNPITVFSEVLSDADNPSEYEATIFPAVRDSAGNPYPPAECETAHAAFVTTSKPVAKWTPVVDNWMRRIFAGN